MRKSILIAATAAGMLAAAPASARPAVCIQRDNIRNWSSIDDKHLVLEDYHHVRALLTLIGTCSNFKFHEAIAIKSPGSVGISCIETGDEVITHDTGMTGHCAVVKIEPYSGPVLERKGDHADHNGDRDDDHHGGD